MAMPNTKTCSDSGLSNQNLNSRTVERPTESTGLLLRDLIQVTTLGLGLGLRLRAYGFRAKFSPYNGEENRKENET